MVSTDREALVSLFRSTGGAGWIRRDNWDTDADLATWNGVNVNVQGRVVNLDLQYNNLQGSIPPELGKLAALRALDLHGNQLIGRIPKELGGLTELKKVTFYHNNLTGRIPEELGNLTALTHLRLNRNSLEGPIPLELGNLAAVQHLSLQENQLSGDSLSISNCVVFHAMVFAPSVESPATVI
ncbi:unnamed protein product [Ectocarpus sp. CCAP 1310/34]|nr:unnamed protein product [Ectocarpus sp. CCAP 1310/34]